MDQNVKPLLIGKISFSGRYYGPDFRIKAPYERVLQTLLRHAIADGGEGDYQLCLFHKVGGSFEQTPIRTGIGRSYHYQDIQLISTDVCIGREMFTLGDEEYMAAYSEVLFAGLLKMEKYLIGKKLPNNILLIQSIARQVIDSYLTLPTPFTMSESELKMLAVMDGNIDPTEVFRPELFDGKVGGKRYEAAMNLVRQFAKKQ